MRVNNRLAAAQGNVCGFRQQRWVFASAWGGGEGSPLGEGGQNVASDSLVFGHVTVDSGWGGLTDLSPAAAGQRGKLCRHLSAW